MFREGTSIFGMYCDKSKVSLHFINYRKNYVYITIIIDQSLHLSERFQLFMKDNECMFTNLKINLFEDLF